MIRTHVTSWPLLLLIAAVALLAGCQLSAEERIGRADAYMAEGDYRSAVIELKNSLRKDPDNATARLLLAESSSQLGDYLTAISEYERVLGYGDERDSTWLGYGRSLLSAGRATDVVERVLLNLESYAVTIDSLLLQADVMMALGNHDEAARHYRAVLDSDATSDKALVGMAAISAARGNRAEASDYIEAALTNNPDSLHAWRAKGNFERLKNNNTGAAEAYARAVSLENVFTPLMDRLIARVNQIGAQLDTRQFDAAESSLGELKLFVPDHPLIDFLDGRLAYGRGEFDKAQGHLLDYMSKMPNDYRGQAVLGAVNFSQNYLRQAEMYLQQAVNRNVGGDAARRLLAETQLRLNKPDDALRSLQSFDDESAEDPALLTMLGRAELGLGNRGAAVEYFERGLRADPDNPDVQISLAVSLIAADDPDRAIQILESMAPVDDPEFRRETLLIAAHLARDEKVNASTVSNQLITDYPESANAYVIAGRLQQTMGNVDAARQRLEQAIDVDGTNTAALYGLGNLLSQTGDLDEALEWFGKTLDVDAGYMPALGRLAQILTAERRIDELEPRIRAAQIAKPQELTPYLLHARAAIVSGKYRDALDIVAAAREIQADAAMLDYTEGLALINSGQRERGLRKLSDAANKLPDVPSVHSDLTRYRLIAGDFDGAIDAIARHRVLLPQHVPGLAIQAEAMALGGYAADARRAVDNFRAKFGDSVDLKIIEGDIEMHSDNNALAVEHYTAASDQLWSRDIVLRIVRASRGAGTTDGVTTLSRWLDDNPADIEMRRLLAQTLELRGDSVAASREYEVVLAQSAEDAVSLNNLAWQYQQQGRTEEAVELAERAHDLVPDNGSISDTLGWILFKHGDVGRAELILRAAVKQSPTNPEIKYHLAALLAETGQNAEARSLLDEILSGEKTFSSRTEAEQLAKNL